jgi:hypothetical protein
MQRACATAIELLAGLIDKRTEDYITGKFG